MNHYNHVWTPYHVFRSGRRYRLCTVCLALLWEPAAVTP